MARGTRNDPGKQDKPRKGERTRQHIYTSALKLFRRQGFEHTTMRDIADQAGLSLGAAYHYFPSKEAIVLNYYAWTQDEHERRHELASEDSSDLRQRLGCLLETKLDLLGSDRKILRTLLRNLIDPDDPLALFSAETARLRQRSMNQFEAVFADLGLSDELRLLLGRVSWLAHVGLLVFFVHDRSKGQNKTRTLTAAVADLIAGAAPWVTHPAAGPVVDRVLGTAREVGLIEAAATASRNVRHKATTRGGPA